MFQLGFPTGGNSTAPLGTLYNNAGTFAVPTGNADYYLYQMNTAGTVDFTGSTNFWLHFAGAVPPINVSGNNTWIGSGSSRIQNDGTAPLVFNLLPGSGLSGFTLMEGIILANGTTNQPIDFTIRRNWLRVRWHRSPHQLEQHRKLHRRYRGKAPGGQRVRPWHRHAHIAV